MSIDESDAIRFLIPQERLQSLASDALSYAKKCGATDAEVSVSEGCSQSISIRCGEVETLESQRDKGLSIRVFLGQHRGSADTSDFSKKAVHDAVAKAVAIARYTAEDCYSGLADADLIFRESVPDLALYHPWHIDVATAVDVARACEQAAFDVDPLISNSDGASVSIGQSHFISAHTGGFMAGYASTHHGIGCSVIAGHDNDMQRGYWGVSGCDAADFSAPARIGDYAARRALANLNPKKLSTRQVPVLFEAPIAQGLLGALIRAASGSMLYSKSSFLCDKLGHTLFPEHVSLTENPFVPKGVASSAFDGDGVRTSVRNVIDRGVLAGYFLSAYSARRLGLKSTGNAGGAHNLRFSDNGDDFDALLKKMDRGLLVTSLMGSGVNYVTGDYSRGASGFWVEKGQIRYPVSEITIAGNLFDMFKNVVSIGNDRLERSGRSMGSVLISSMTVAGS